MQSFEDKREKMFNELLMRGHATMRELLTASFGEWPPKGLDIDKDLPHSQRVSLHRTVDFKDMGVAYADERRIDISDIYSSFLPKFLGGGSGVSTLGHEAVHILQFDHLVRPNDIFRINLPKGSVPEDSMSRYNEMANVMSSDKTEAESKGTLSKLFNKVARSRSKFEYMSDDMEMQSHLHEVLIEGYNKWGRLPSNKDELLAALYSAKVSQPKYIKEYLKNLSKDSSAQDFLKVNVKSSKAAKRINSFTKLLSGEVTRKFFWNRAMPMIYSDLIEMYGDRPGRGRFNLGVNKREVFYKKSLDKKPLYKNKTSGNPPVILPWV